MENIEKNINIIETEYNNTSNKLKNISTKRFMEHIVEEENFPSIEEATRPKMRENQVLILSKEERERNILINFKESICKSLENLNIKNLIEIKDNNNNENASILDDDNASISSSKYFANFQKQKNLNVKLPYIIGTVDYFKSEFLGIASNSSLIGNLSLSSTSILNSSNMNNNNEKNNFKEYNKNANGVIKKDENLEKLNMNLIEQIYDKKNSFNAGQQPSEENQLNELLYKNRQNNSNFNNKTSGIYYEDNNPILDDKLRNIYNNKPITANTIKDPNFIDFTQMNQNIPEINMNVNNENTNSLIPENEKEKNIFNLDKNLADNSTPLIPNYPSNEPNNNANPSRRITLDHFVKKNNLFDINNLLDNEEDDDNTGLFNKQREGKFSLIPKKKNNLFTEADLSTEKEKDKEKALAAANQKEFRYSSNLDSNQRDQAEIAEESSNNNRNHHPTNINKIAYDKEKLDNILKIIDEPEAEVETKQKNKFFDETKKLQEKANNTNNAFGDTTLLANSNLIQAAAADVEVNAEKAKFQKSRNALANNTVKLFTGKLFDDEDEDDLNSDLIKSKTLLKQNKALKDIKDEKHIHVNNHLEGINLFAPAEKKNSLTSKLYYICMFLYISTTI